jgi:hypothetical protein
VQTKTETSYGSRVFDEVDGRAQFLMSLGEGMITGVYFSIYREDTSPFTAVGAEPGKSNSNYSQVHTVNYDADGTGTAKAEVKEDYVVKTDETANEKTMELRAGLPLYLENGSMAHSLLFGFGFDFANNSDSYSQDYTKAENALGAVTDTLADNTTDESMDATALLGYDVKAPAFWGGEENNFYAGGDLSYTFHSYKGGSEVHTKSWNMPGGGTETLTGESHTTTEQEYSSRFDMEASGWAAHSFHYEIGDGAVFGLQPRFDLGFDLEPDSQTFLEKQVVTTKVDDDGNGSFTDAVDTYTVETTVYEGKANDYTISADISCPMALQFKREGWLFGFTFGGRPELSYSVSFDNAPTVTSTTTTQDKVNNTEEVSESTASVSETSQVSHTWGLSESTKMNIYFDFNENVRFDVEINGSNLFNFESLKVQAIIALP